MAGLFLFFFVVLFFLNFFNHHLLFDLSRDLLWSLELAIFLVYNDNRVVIRLAFKVKHFSYAVRCLHLFQMSHWTCSDFMGRTICYSKIDWFSFGSVLHVFYNWCVLGWTATSWRFRRRALDPFWQTRKAVRQVFYSCLKVEFLYLLWERLWKHTVCSSGCAHWVLADWFSLLEWLRWSFYVDEWLALLSWVLLVLVSCGESLLYILSLVCVYSRFCSHLWFNQRSFVIMLRAADLV